MKRTSPEHLLTPKADLTPMIDVTFLILIFFLCTLRFKTLEGQLGAYLPKDGGAASTPAEAPEALEVGIRVVREGQRLAPNGEAPWDASGGGRYVWSSDRQVSYSLGPRRGLDLAQLRSELARYGTSSEATDVVLAPANGVVQAEVVTVLDALIDAGYLSVRVRGAER